MGDLVLLGSKGWWGGVFEGCSRVSGIHSIDLLPNLWLLHLICFCFDLN